jgi:hypothetical protein
VEGRYVPAAAPTGRFLRDRFIKRISSLGEVRRHIPFIHGGRQTKFTANSLLIPCSQDKICIFWADFGDFGMEFEKFTVNFAVLVIRMETQAEIGLFDSSMSAEGHTKRGSALAGSETSSVRLILQF